MADGRAYEVVPEDPVSDDAGHALQDKHSSGYRHTGIEIMEDGGFVRGKWWRQTA